MQSQTKAIRTRFPIKGNMCSFVVVKLYRICIKYQLSNRGPIEALCIFVRNIYRPIACYFTGNICVQVIAAASYYLVFGGLQGCG